MTDSSQLPLLWIDDDGPRRFVYETKLLERAGWQVSWARGVEAAVETLAERVFTAVLLDQMLPMGDPVQDRANVWQGCLLLYWLRRKPAPSQAPASREWQKIGSRAPLAKNRHAKVLLVSAYYDTEVDKAIRAIEPALVAITKPIDADLLLKELGNLHAR